MLLLRRRECWKFGVLYVGPTQERQHEILMNERGSPEYESFLWSLGWRASVSEHKGFLGGLDNSSSRTTGDVFPYYADSSVVRWAGSSSPFLCFLAAAAAAAAGKKKYQLLSLATHRQEVAFHVATLIPTVKDDPQQINKKSSSTTQW